MFQRRKKQFQVRLLGLLTRLGVVTGSPEIVPAPSFTTPIQSAPTYVYVYRCPGSPEAPGSSGLPCFSARHSAGPVPRSAEVSLQPNQSSLLLQARHCTACSIDWIRFYRQGEPMKPRLRFEQLPASCPAASKLSPQETLLAACLDQPTRDALEQTSANFRRTNR